MALATFRFIRWQALTAGKARQAVAMLGNVILILSLHTAFDFASFFVAAITYLGPMP